MVVIWGNILSFIGNVVALAVEVLVFNAFFPRNESRKSQWLCILLWWAIATFLSLSVGTKLGYTLKMLQEVALIYLFCAFLYQSRWDRRLFIVVTVYSVLFSYSHWFDELCMRISGFTYEEYIWNVPLYSIFFFLRCSFILAFAFIKQISTTNRYMQEHNQGLGSPYPLLFLFAHCLCSGRYIPPRKNNVYGRFVC